VSAKLFAGASAVDRDRHPVLAEADRPLVGGQGENGVIDPE
jgi:hypothetical protein